MTRYMTVVTTLRGSVHPEAKDARTYDGSYRPRPVKPFVVAVVECAICGIRRQCVNDVCDVCRANGAVTG